jgi:cytochrome c oxidase cbb3-type subunit 3
MAQKRIDEATGVETTGHEYDGIAELNNPMPRWWVSLFYATIVWGVGYTILFPAWPTLSGHTAGLLGYTSRGEVIERIAAHAEMQSVWRERIAAASFEEIKADQDLFAFAQASGAANFALNCSQCHGSGAAGNTGGFPNLNDDDWIWGGDIEAIHLTISHGVRNAEDADARYSEMPKYGVDELLTKDEISAVAQHVLNFTGRATKPELLETGATIFAENCAACHGEEGLGGPEVGAPNLADAIWLYGGSEAELVAQISNPRQGVMPPWTARLGDTAVKELAVYVHSLGGGR